MISTSLCHHVLRRLLPAEGLPRDEPAPRCEGRHGRWLVWRYCGEPDVFADGAGLAGEWLRKFLRDDDVYRRRRMTLPAVDFSCSTRPDSHLL